MCYGSDDDREEDEFLESSDTLVSSRMSLFAGADDNGWLGGTVKIYNNQVMELAWTEDQPCCVVEGENMAGGMIL